VHIFENYILLNCFLNEMGKDLLIILIKMKTQKGQTIAPEGFTIKKTTAVNDRDNSTSNNPSLAT